MNLIANFVIVLALMSHLISGLDPAKDVEGKDCKVIEPTRNYTFNLKGLTRDLTQWIQSSDLPEQFSHNLCGPMSQKCNNQTAAACMKDVSGKEVVIGVDEKLYYNDGGIRFTFSGAKCNDQKNYTVNVMLECDYNVNEVGAFHVSGSCEITIVQHTPLACLPIPDNAKDANCMVKSPSGAVFNFNSLRNSNHVADPHGNGTKYIIGICNPVLNGHEIACEAGTSVCRVDTKATNESLRYINMGMQTQAFKFNNDDVSLTLTSNEPCGNGKKFSSKIHFECDRNAGSGEPTYHATIDCINIFSWPTSVVCLGKKLCRVENTESKADFDFSSLMGLQYEAVNKNNSEEKIKFSICSDAGEPCMKNTGSCVVKGKQSTNAGKVNSDLKLAADLKSPYLLYEDGAVCKTQGHKFTTRIDFICADNATDEGAIAIEDGCDITIHFKTLLACKFIKNCVGKDDNGEEIDLRPLIDFDGNYVATVNEKNLPKETGNVRYLLNVCRPLNSKYSLNCRGSSGACRTVVDENEKHEQELNLGHPDYSMHSRKVKDTNEVTMKYFGGGTCPSDSAEEAITKIRFFCDEKVGLGNPVLQAIENCEYEFDFPTNILCNEQSVDLENKNKSCNLVNDKISVSVDLKLFGSDGVYKVGDKSVDICGGGEKKIYTIVYKQSLVRVEFSLANGKDKVDVEVRLKCSASNFSTSSTNEDGILVVHESPLICPLLKIAPKASSSDDTPSNPDDGNGGKAESSSSGLALGYVFLISIVLVAFVAFYVIIRNPERREIIRNLIKFRSTSNVQYSRVRVNEESLLLNNNAAGLSDSDDDDNILL